MIRPLIVLILTITSLTLRVYCQTPFIVKDVLAADPGANIIDPEYNVPLNSVCWQSAEGELWVCGLDPVTHCYVPSDGKGIQVDYDLTYPGPGGWNGPEWMLSKGCTQIVYNQKKGGVRYPGLATKVLGGWNSSTLMQYPGALYAMATHNYTDSSGVFLFESVSNDGIRWVRSNDLNTCYFYPDITLGFFADDDQQICCAINHSRQPGYVEVAATLPFFTQISNDTIGAPAMWNDPETNSRLFMYRTNNYKTLKVFREVSEGQWELYNSFDSPLPEPYDYITSPESFIFDGRSYVSFMAAQSSMGLDLLPAQIWIASINPDYPLMRRVSDSIEMVRVDPEPVVFSDSVFIYYTEKVWTRCWFLAHRVRKCDTGLESGIITRLEDNPEESVTVRVFPNPSGGKITIESDILRTEPEATLSILDASGRTVKVTTVRGNPCRLTMNDLTPGVYHLTLTGRSRTSGTKVIICR